MVAVALVGDGHSCTRDGSLLGVPDEPGDLTRVELRGGGGRDRGHEHQEDPDSHKAALLFSGGHQIVARNTLDAMTLSTAECSKSAMVRPSNLQHRVHENGRRFRRPFHSVGRVYRLLPVVYFMQAPPGRDHILMPRNSRAWSLEAFFCAAATLQRYCKNSTIRACASHGSCCSAYFRSS